MREGIAGRGTAGLASGAPTLSVRGVSKGFPGTRALDQVDMDVRAGEIHALCGGNGSGKSTLVKILCGVYQADTGTVRIGAEEHEAAHMRPKLARDLGVRVVHQDLALFPDLTVAENMLLGAGLPLSSAGTIRWGELRRQAQAQLDRFEIAAKPETLMRDLPIATRAQVAIARALQDVSAGEGILILDEPTASLPVHEVGLLLDAIRRLAAAGQAILFVSHRLDEVLAVTQRVTVLRDGRVFAEHKTADLTESELIEAIIGAQGARADAAARRSRQAHRATTPVLEVKDLWAGPLRGATLDVMPGEIIGIAGLLGSGRTELLRAIYGDLAVRRGKIAVNGKPANFRRMDQAIAAGVVLIPEDRPGSGAFADLSVDENLNVSVWGRYWGALGFQRSKLKQDAAHWREQLRVRAASGQVAMRSLSGGNQQKAILGRWLRRDPVLLLLDEPTQGIDVGARADIHAATRDVVERGGAAVVVLSDLEELAQLVDRALVLRHGVISAEVTGQELTATRITELIYEGTGSQSQITRREVDV